MGGGEGDVRSKKGLIRLDWRFLLDTEEGGKERDELEKQQGSMRPIILYILERIQRNDPFNPSA